MNKLRVGIIGGGAAGMMAAATLLQISDKVEIALFERNQMLGKKVIISGGGRCNVTTGITDVREVLTRYPRGGAFLTSAMYAFPPKAVRTWFENKGVPLKEEEDGRIFPESDDGHDVVGAFEQIFRKHHVALRLGSNVIRVIPPSPETPHFTLTLKGDRVEVCDRLILTTGGQAYRATGSTGDGYAFAQSCGHTITPLAPSLNSLLTVESWPKELAGVSFQDVVVSLKKDPSVKARGGMVCTHHGISGPAVFAFSAKSAYETMSRLQPLELTVDLIPSLSKDALQEALLRLVHEHPKQHPVNLLRTWLPHSVSEMVAAHIKLPAKASCEVKHDVWRHLSAFLKAVPLSAHTRGAGDEFVTAGGVSLAEVDPRSMESKLCPGLFFAGEILDVDGVTGGFNLQASWATGRLAGESASR